jgi:hypothetical protein
MKVLMTLVLVLLLAGCAAGRGDSAGSTTTQEETTAYKEETTVLTAGDFPKPPDSTLSYGGREVKGTLGTYCWESGKSGVCADAAWPVIPSKRNTLTVPPGSEMVFRYGGQSPPKVFRYGGKDYRKMGGVEAYSLKKLQKTGTFRPDSILKVHGSGVERTIPAELPPGEYVVDVHVEVPQGGTNYFFRVMVE